MFQQEFLKKESSIPEFQLVINYFFASNIKKIDVILNVIWYITSTSSVKIYYF